MANDELGTPPGVYDALSRIVGPFEYDAACSPENALAEPLGDGLVVVWPAGRIWCNPPYSAPAPWVDKALESSGWGSVVCLLLPSDTSTSWFGRLVGARARLIFLQNRLRFVGSPGRARFGSLAAVVGPGIQESVEVLLLTPGQRGH